MKDKYKLKRKGSDRRQKRTRKKIRGTSLKPRISVYKSLNHIYVQLIDDERGVTITGVSSLTSEVKKLVKKEDNKTEVSKRVGLYLAKLAQGKGLKAMVFDRNRFRYHGRVKALAQGVREGGLKF
ncbi:MAG: 50S ribosomal protein L18 [Candidatus Zixiibacteriota bacterium]